MSIILPQKGCDPCHVIQNTEIDRSVIFFVTSRTAKTRTFRSLCHTTGDLDQHEEQAHDCLEHALKQLGRVPM